MRSIFRGQFLTLLLLSVTLIVFVAACDNPTGSDSNGGGSDSSDSDDGSGGGEGSDNGHGDTGGITGPWALSVSDTSQRTVFESVTTDDAGNIYAVGVQDGSGSVSYGNGVSTAGPRNGENAVVVKYNANGEAQWARTPASAPGASVFQAVAVDGDGNIYAAGYQLTDQIFDYGNGVTVASAIDNRLIGNMVIVKYNSSGEAQWARSVTDYSGFNTSGDSSRINDLAVDQDGNVYTVGRISEGTYTLSEEGEEEVTVAASGVSDDYQNSMIIKYNSDGVPQWANAVSVEFEGSTTRDTDFLAVAVSDQGYIYAAGYQRSRNTYTYGTTPDDDPVSIEGIGIRHIAIVQYDSDGNALRARTLDDRVSNTMFRALATGNDGTVYAAGYQQRDGEYTYGPGVSVAGSAGSPFGVRNAVIVAYNSDLEAQWARSTTEGEVNSEFYSIAVDENGTVHAVGYKRDIDPLSFADGLTVEGSSTIENALIVSYTADGTTQSARTTIAGTGDTIFRGATTMGGDLIVVGQQRSTHTYEYADGLEATGTANAWPNAVIVAY